MPEITQSRHHRATPSRHFYAITASVSRQIQGGSESLSQAYSRVELGASGHASDSFGEFHTTQISVRPATASWERARYFALRKKVFSGEQQLPIQEQDGEDFRATAIIALANLCGISDDVVGAVRIFPVDDPRWPGLWFGGRLCVVRPYRGRAGIGKALINTAVSRAKHLGCQHFHAFVQKQNGRYFSSLHWHTIEELDIGGRPHLRMVADLNHYPLPQLPPPTLLLDEPAQTRETC
ncbi:putative N-acetyltransferase [Spongiibacter sp. IMCC21906]|jgi:putative N-acetyltransferase (TIGR04045 family)|uniref:MSMEG_0567/Sll0786 family nitrogen starvation N-acetyltransferase n=1 Tax=Spongiibacter sp. IMCC21906 TaxID=1620392 RepID=UPI00062E0A0F|nr:MSMEG_0567/Sll0786 family nitrogen starvation N-acetyltransferase [Spongiibacter sp. IMCC21906]AKH68938.1 putative N-acetyltransferase [Spongiibacter sp. IMCC21906]